MSRTLNLARQLLARSRTFQKLGREQDALGILGKLAGFRELPGDVAEETQACLAELHLRRKRFVKARRHLTAALVHKPNNARYHYLIAQALDTADKGDTERAAEHYRRALELDPQQPRCLADFGLLSLRLGQIEEGLKCLCRAVEMAPGDQELVQKLADGLHQVDRDDEARSVLRAALFRNPRDPRFRKLWNGFQFQRLREQQQAERASEQELLNGDGRQLLPFVRPATESREIVGCKIVRRDQASPTPPPHLPSPNRYPGRKHA